MAREPLIDGLVIVPAAADQSYLIAERNRGTCVVFLDREPRLLIADAVVSSNRSGAAAAVDHLLSSGHERIAYLGDSLSVATAAQRYEGYQQALERARLETDPLIVRHELRTVEAAVQAATGLLGQPKPPTAVFTSQNLVTIGAIKALRQAGMQDTIALVGFDDFPLADTLTPGVTVIRQDVQKLGMLATQLLFGRLDGDASPARTHIVETSLVARGSGEIRPSSALASAG